MSMDQPVESASWEDAIARLLQQLSDVQEELLELLSSKRRMLAKGELKAVADLQPREESLARRLQQCHADRERLLEAARDEGMQANSLRTLSGLAGVGGARDMEKTFKEARRRARLIQHQSITNWLLVQRTLLHLSQMVEILATGGQRQPTYDSGARSRAGGSLMDHAA